MDFKEGIKEPHITILGTGAGIGSPGFCCDCEGCREARVNPIAARTRCGVHLSTGEYSILIDTSPDLRAQLIREQINKVDIIFYTHWHWDHFGGLCELEYYVKLHRKELIRVYALPDCLHNLEATFPNMLDCITMTPLSFGETVIINELSLTAYPAKHGRTETAGYLIERDGMCAAYFPDTAGLPDETYEAIRDVDYFICDCSFFGNNTFPQSHMSVEDSIALGRKINAKHTILTHHSIHYSVQKTLAEMEKLLLDKSVSIGYDGMRIW